MTTWLRRRSFRVRLSALVAAAVGVAVGLIAFASYVAVHHQLYSQVGLGHAERDERRPTTLRREEGLNPVRAADVLRRYSNSVFQVVTPDGTPQ